MIKVYEGNVDSTSGKSLEIGLRQVKYILRSIAKGDDHREIADKCADLVDLAANFISNVSSSEEDDDMFKTIQHWIEQSVMLGTDVVNLRTQLAAKENDIIELQEVNRQFAEATERWDAVSDEVQAKISAKDKEIALLERALERIVILTPSKANTTTAIDHYTTTAAIAESALVRVKEFRNEKITDKFKEVKDPRDEVAAASGGTALGIS